LSGVIRSLEFSALKKMGRTKEASIFGLKNAVTTEVPLI